MAAVAAEDLVAPPLDRIPSAPSRPTLSNAGRPLLRRVGSTAGGLFKPPTLANLKGRWHITHSTLPIWRDKRNVTITYTVLPDKGGSQREEKGGANGDSPNGTCEDGSRRLEDVIEYQERGRNKVHTVRGVDTVSSAGSENSTAAWNWRGKGIIKIASSHWEILGWGIDDGGNASLAELSEKENGTVISGAAADLDADAPHERQWMVTYFAKTYFTPAGMDIYSRHPGGVSVKLFEQIRQALREINMPQLAELAEGLYEVTRDGDRQF
ncbi:MAG: hypothetical protein M1822_005273 [Bathelium mastoideum]|nr:MAG: hypothetical protein M1822_005273 [Bathelium mastoideum]